MDIASLFSGLENASTDRSLARSALAQLRSMLIEGCPRAHQNRRQICCYGEWLAPLKRILYLWSHDHDIQLFCYDCISCLVAGVPEDDEVAWWCLLDDDLVESMTMSLGRYPKSELLHSRVTALLVTSLTGLRHVGNNPPTIHFVDSLLGHRLILRSMHDFPINPEVQINGCLILRCILPKLSPVSVEVCKEFFRPVAKTAIHHNFRNNKDIKTIFINLLRELFATEDWRDLL